MLCIQDWGSCRDQAVVPVRLKSEILNVSYYFQHILVNKEKHNVDDQQPGHCSIGERNKVSLSYNTMIGIVLLFSLECGFSRFR